MSNFNLYSQYYDLLYADKDYKSETSYVKSLLDKYSKVPVNSILELGSGSGGHAQFFSQYNISVTGLEKSEEMAALSRRKNIPGFEPLVADITSFNLNNKFDAAVSLFHVVSYITDNTKLINCFQETNRHLKPGGLFVFDTWYTPAVLTQQPQVRIRRLEDNDMRVTRLAEPVIHHENNVVDVNYEIWIKNRKTDEINILHETHPMRHFGIPEIALLSKLTGFELITAESFMTGDKPSPDSWGVCFVLKKSI